MALHEGCVSVRADLIHLQSWTLSPETLGDCVYRREGIPPVSLVRVPGLIFILAGGCFFPRDGNSFPKAGEE